MNATADYSSGKPIIKCPACGYENCSQMEVVFAIICKNCGMGLDIENEPPELVS